MIALTAAALLTPTERIDDALLLIEDGVIAEVSSRTHRSVPSNARTADFADAILAPGLIDIHIHGGAGRDVMERTPEALPTVEKLLAGHGVTSYYPTTVSAPLEDILSALEHLANAIEAWFLVGRDDRRVNLPAVDHRRAARHQGEMNLSAAALGVRLEIRITKLE